MNCSRMKRKKWLVTQRERGDLQFGRQLVELFFPKNTYSFIFSFPFLVPSPLSYFYKFKRQNIRELQKVGENVPTESVSKRRHKSLGRRKGGEKNDCPGSKMEEVREQRVDPQLRFHISRGEIVCGMKRRRDNELVCGGKKWAESDLGVERIKVIP